MNITPSVEVIVKICGKCGGNYTTRRCRPCANAYTRAYNLANPEKRVATYLAYGAANREKVAAKAREWYWANLDKAKESRAAYRKTHAGETQVANRKYYEANKQKVNDYARAWSKAHPEVARLGGAESKGKTRRIRRKAFQGIGI